MKTLSQIRLLLQRVVIAGLIGITQAANAQGSINSEMDAINAHARANAEAMKGKGIQEVQVMPSGTAEDRANAATKKSGKCSFSSYALGDDKGKLLAKAARDECYRNEELKARGQADQTTNEAYEQWKDHRLITKRVMPAQNKPTNCRPDGFGLGGLICQ